MANVKKYDCDKNVTNLKHFVTCAENTIGVDFSTKTGVPVVPKSVTKLKHFVTR